MNVTKKAWILAICGMIAALLSLAVVGIPFAIILAVVQIRYMLRHKSEVWLAGEDEYKYSPLTLMVVSIIGDIAMTILMLGLAFGFIEV